MHSRGRVHGVPGGKTIWRAHRVHAFPTDSVVSSITLCPFFFSLPNIGNFGTPPANLAALGVINTFSKTASVVAIHEMAHLINDGKITSVQFPFSHLYHCC